MLRPKKVVTLILKKNVFNVKHQVKNVIFGLHQERRKKFLSERQNSEKGHYFVEKARTIHKIFCLLTNIFSKKQKNEDTVCCIHSCTLHRGRRKIALPSSRIWAKSEFFG